MKKHTHKGNCQVCGKLSAITVRGVIAHHGCIVDGKHEKRCYGSGRLPLQKSKELTEDNIEMHKWYVNEEIPFQIKRLDKFIPTIYRVFHNNLGTVSVVSNIDKYDNAPEGLYDISVITVDEAVKIIRDKGRTIKGKEVTAEDILGDCRWKERKMLEREMDDRMVQIEDLQIMINEIHGQRLIPNN